MRKPRFYFSFRSPFSWMVSHVLERELPGWHDELELLPYFEPDEQTWPVLDERGVEMHYSDMSKAKHLYILQDTKRLSARHGLSMTWPVDRDPWWVLPHHAWMAARRIGRGKDLYWALSEARWERGENICDADVVEKIADSIDLDGALITRAHEDPEIRAEGVDALEKAYMDDVFGIPFFKMGPHRFWGLDRVHDFLSAYERAREKEMAK
jgi:2-hydroxychromene-2-carboxylate isomerase